MKIHCWRSTAEDCISVRKAEDKIKSRIPLLFSFLCGQVIFQWPHDFIAHALCACLAEMERQFIGGFADFPLDGLGLHGGGGL